MKEQLEEAKIFIEEAAEDLKSAYSRFKASGIGFDKQKAFQDYCEVSVGAMKAALVIINTTLTNLAAEKPTGLSKRKPFMAEDEAEEDPDEDDV